MAADLQSMLGDVRAASEPLVQRLEPAAASWVKVELQRLGRDVVLLERAAARTEEKLEVGNFPLWFGGGTDASTRLLRRRSGWF